MLSTQKLIVVLMLNIGCLSLASANTQSQSKGLINDSSISILLRNGFIQRDKKNDVIDTNSWLQSALVTAESGFTQGSIGFGMDIIGDFSFKLGDNLHAGNNMLALKNNGQQDAQHHVQPYDQWTRGGGAIKARISNTTAKYGTQILDLPVLASMTTRNVPEYFTGLLVNSNEINNLQLVAGKFTKNQLPNHIASDQNHLDRAIVWGAKYQVNQQLNTAYYGADLQNKLERHYINLNYQQTLPQNSQLTYNLSAYHTKFQPTASTSSASVSTDEHKKNTIVGLSANYHIDAHDIALSYQQNSGNVGYDYGQNADGGQSVYLPNSYLSDFIGNDEKSIGLRYTLDFEKFGLTGLHWSTAYVYGWDIKVNGLTESAKEREWFNQMSYSMQNGIAKDLAVKVRHSIYRASDAYQSNIYIGDTNEWRIFVEYPLHLF